MKWIDIMNGRNEWMKWTDKVNEWNEWMKWIDKMNEKKELRFLNLMKNWWKFRMWLNSPLLWKFNAEKKIHQYDDNRNNKKLM